MKNNIKKQENFKKQKDEAYSNYLSILSFLDASAYTLADYVLDDRASAITALVLSVILFASFICTFKVLQLRHNHLGNYGYG